MPYEYETQKKAIFTDEGQRLFLRIRDNTLEILKDSGTITMGKAISCGGTSDVWDRLACVDRMVELGDIKEIQQKKDCAAQHRIFVGVYR